MKAAPRYRRMTANSPSLQPESALAQEQRAFQQQREKLLRRYAGEYVALQGGRVVAHGRDDETLAAQMFARVGDEPFYIAHVGEMPVIAEIPSPELVR